ncbi:MAG TPA: MarR family transcriptional regulator [Solirubrobacteraceae bacterium]|jgi:DNA-binding MarR family transcriptional regulator|nr:MarR family transcriptional regulator [Solirubrobacteraceae bacterium]
MSSQSRKAELGDRLGDLVRESQRGTDITDDLLCQLLGINRSDSRCLDILDQRGRMTAGALAQESGLSTGAITAVIDRLEQAGYAQRVADPADRRRVMVELTDKARQAAYELMAGPMMVAGELLMERYSERDLELMIDFMERGAEIRDNHIAWLQAKLDERATGS